MEPTFQVASRNDMLVLLRPSLAGYALVFAMPQPSLNGDALVVVLILLYCAFLDKKKIMAMYFYGRLPPDAKALVQLARTMRTAVEP
ncbi:hypothetical protein EVAR_19182_1 [Eumeta japonica]|uniref:Uncharacterized protein n=1 Tax=Eumeta variegata TaxID=151549 RepID=A0A4C1VMX6_EUMVA|nr:hypothetical protein EVAR_19182_1 [Eumeta japonica]